MIKGWAKGGSSDRTGVLAQSGLRYLVIAGAVVLGWEVVKAPLEERAPPAIAVRISPGSPLVLQRAAEDEYAAGRNDNARELAEEALVRAPFNVRALRVLGLSYARSGDAARADDLVTLAGNWSLRDDPAHAWLVDQRLRRGDFHSSFAHADTLARRRPDIYPQLFQFFTTAAAHSPRGLSALAGLLSRSPPWREAFLDHLYSLPDGDQALGSLALAMQSGEGRFSDEELSRLYLHWTDERRVQGLRLLRESLGRPGLTELLQDADFSGPAAPSPFSWAIDPAPGLIVAVSEEGDGNRGNALRVQYTGTKSAVAAYQLMLLQPGTYTLRGRFRMDQGAGELPLAWTVVCLESSRSLMESTITAPDVLAPQAWLPFDGTFNVPSTGCSAQWIRLMTRPSDRRTTFVAWFDGLDLSRGAAA